MKKFNLESIKEYVKEKSKDSAKDIIKAILLKVVLVILAVIICIKVPLAIYDYGMNRYECHVAWYESGIEYKYTLRGGCRLLINEGWIPAKNYRIL